MYLDSAKTLDELKAQYRAWTKRLHPDCGGSDADMKALNLEYERFFEILKNKHNATADQQHQTTENASDFMDIIDHLIRMEGIQVELCGSWLWITGNTYQNRDNLKACGCRWSSSKKKWYWRPAETGYQGKHKAKTMEEIRERYGSQMYTGNNHGFRPTLQGA